MPSVLSRIAELEHKFLKYAPKQNQVRIKKVLGIYQERANLNFNAVQNMVLALYSPSLLGRDKVEKMYENFLSKYQNEEKHPQDWTRGMTAKEKLEERRDRLLGVKRTYQLNVILFTQEQRLQSKTEDKLDRKPLIEPVALPTGTKKPRKNMDSMFLPKGTKTKRLKGMVQVARLNLTVKA